MSTFVLVHGAWHGGWCWNKIVARLSAQGHTVVAPDMPGHGIDRTPINDVTMDGIVAKMTGVIREQQEPVVLVGHSYGGAVITATAEACADRVRALVYVTAFIVPNGKSTMELAQEDTENQLGPNIVFAEDGKSATANPAVLKPVFYAQCGDDDIALARMLLVPEATAGFQAPIITTAERWGELPKFYVECTRDRAISIAQQRRMQPHGPCQKVFTLDTDHSPFFSMPDQLAAILAGL
jgi:pimeloyl-ACP methyl ester carboxylesterase